LWRVLKDSKCKLFTYQGCHHTQYLGIVKNAVCEDTRVEWKFINKTSADISSLKFITTLHTKNELESGRNEILCLKLQEIIIYTYIVTSVKHARSQTLKAQSIKKTYMNTKPRSRRNMWSTFLHYVLGFIHITYILEIIQKKMFKNKYELETSRFGRIYTMVRPRFNAPGPECE
jgi:hypothetical protein